MYKKTCFVVLKSSNAALAASAFSFRDTVGTDRHFPKKRIGYKSRHSLCSGLWMSLPPPTKSNSPYLPLPSLSASCWFLNISSAGGGEYLIEKLQDVRLFLCKQAQLPKCSLPCVHQAMQYSKQKHYNDFR